MKPKNLKLKKDKDKSCGNCRFFGKFKNDIIGGGLCDLLDCRTKTDSRPDCKYWKGIKYKRVTIVPCKECHEHPCTC